MTDSQRNVTLSYGYYVNGNRKSMAVIKAGKTLGNVGYEYTDNNMVSSVTDFDGDKTVYGYYPFGGLKTITRPNGVVTTYDYHDLTHQVKKITHKDRFGSAINYFEYPEYDNVGNRMRMRSLTGETLYDYDSLYQLRDVKYSGGREVSYFYDKVGNRKHMTETIPGEPVVNTGYTYEVNNELKQLTANGVTTAFTYDENGNQTTKGTTRFAWDEKNRLGIIYYPAGSNIPASRCRYNANGLRETMTNLTFTTGTRYFYDGTDVVMETDAGSTITALYTVGAGEIVSKKIRWDTGVWSKMYYLYDALDNTMNLTDDRGNLLQTYYYDAFGKCMNVSRDPGNKMQFVGGYGIQTDEDSGVQYMRARYYDPDLGRFISKISGAIQSTYIYCFNNPVNNNDVTGLVEPQTVKIARETLERLFPDLGGNIKNKPVVFDESIQGNSDTNGIIRLKTSSMLNEKSEVDPDVVAAYLAHEATHNSKKYNGTTDTIEQESVAEINKARLWLEVRNGKKDLTGQLDVWVAALKMGPEGVKALVRQLYGKMPEKQ